jgi:hypothetical protein
MSKTEKEIFTPTYELVLYKRTMVGWRDATPNTGKSTPSPGGPATPRNSVWRAAPRCGGLARGGPYPTPPNKKSV